MTVGRSRPSEEDFKKYDSPAYPLTLPALTSALKLGETAAQVGFDWATAEEVLLKIDEELNEVKAELAERDPLRLRDEIGDVLFTVASLARKLGLDPEAWLQHGNDKFVLRLNEMERLAAQAGKTLSALKLSEQEDLWQAAKVRLKTNL